MTCCFMNFREKDSEKDLIRHFDREIDIAIGRGCSVFMTGTRYPEDVIFADRVKNISKYYADGEIKLVCIDETEEKLKKRFIHEADWEIYAYDLDEYPLLAK